MTILHSKPTKKINKPYDLGTEEKWELKNINNASLSFNTIAGGTERIKESKSDRIMIIQNGFATNLDTKEVIRDGSVIEIPAGVALRVQGQIKYYMISLN